MYEEREIGYFDELQVIVIVLPKDSIAAKAPSLELDDVLLTSTLFKPFAPSCKSLAENPDFADMLIEIDATMK